MIHCSKCLSNLHVVVPSGTLNLQEIRLNRRLVHRFRHCLLSPNKNLLFWIRNREYFVIVCNLEVMLTLNKTILHSFNLKTVLIIWRAQQFSACPSIAFTGSWTPFSEVIFESQMFPKIPCSVGLTFFRHLLQSTMTSEKINEKYFPLE